MAVDDPHELVAGFLAEVAVSAPGFEGEVGVTGSQQFSCVLLLGGEGVAEVLETHSSVVAGVVSPDKKP